MMRVNGKEEDNQENLLTMSEEKFRLAEYNKLITTYGNERIDLHTVNYPIDKYNSSIIDYFHSISLVKKLRETRAFLGFSRVQPNTSIGIDVKKEMLSNTEVNWLPAIVVYGEGVFFQFNKSKIMNWMKNKNVEQRISYLNKNYNKFCIKLGRDTVNLNPVYVMIHTFAHLLINQLSFDCGYGSSERVALGDRMPSFIST